MNFLTVHSRINPRQWFVAFAFLLCILVCQSFSMAAFAEAIQKNVNSIAMPVYYATNRQRITARSAPIYSRKRRYLSGLEYGECMVTLPVKGIDFSATRDYSLGWRGQAPKLKVPAVSVTKSQFGTERDFLDEFSRRVKKADGGVLFIHGYKSTFDGALTIGAQLSSTFHQPVVIFSWPSSEQYQGYMKDECNIEWSLPHFRKLLQQIESEIGADKLTLVAHSMGNRLLMWSLRDRCADAKCHQQELTKFSHVVLTSPDVDTGTFKNYASEVCENSKATLILTSGKDNALGASKTIHERRRLGMPGPDGVDIDWRQPPTIDGMKTVEFTLLDQGLVGHTIQYGLITSLVRTGEPGVRLELKPEARGGYSWLKVVRSN